MNEKIMRIKNEEMRKMENGKWKMENGKWKLSWSKIDQRG
jgi:hypothetical protein